MDSNEVLRRVSEALEANKIPYMLVGSFASSYYGAIRSTADIDFVIDGDLNQIQELARYMREKQYYVTENDSLNAWRQRSMFNVIDLTVSWKIDFIFVKPRAFSREEFHRRTPIVFEGIPLVVATKEDTIISKLEWTKLGGSARQIEDVSSLVKKHQNSLDHSYLNKWITELGLTSQWNDARRQAGIE